MKHALALLLLLAIQGIACGKHFHVVIELPTKCDRGHYYIADENSKIYICLRSGKGIASYERYNGALPRNMTLTSADWGTATNLKIYNNWVVGDNTILSGESVQAYPDPSFKLPPSQPFPLLRWLMALLAIALVALGLNEWAGQREAKRPSLLVAVEQQPEYFEYKWMVPVGERQTVRF